MHCDEAATGGHHVVEYDQIPRVWKGLYVQLQSLPANIGAWATLIMRVGCCTICRFGNTVRYNEVPSALVINQAKYLRQPRIVPRIPAHFGRRHRNEYRIP